MSILILISLLLGYFILYAASEAVWRSLEDQAKRRKESDQ
ncbi:hypothetical protein LCGC14_1204900 [marine sediment metagenome]|uniref:Uncharacterized protein n=1 Tax=marine sediment metagenome TaxID=412755 RepID=A0A0F9PKL7_9ZZZZ